VVATRSELAVRRWSIVTDELIGQLRLSRWSGFVGRRELENVTFELVLVPRAEPVEFISLFLISGSWATFFARLK
jgi:hypothetical protein